MNKLQIFKNEEFGTIRSLEINNEPYFIGKDICILFGDTNYRRSLSNIDIEDKMLIPINTAGGRQNMTVINENGLYDLLFNMQPQKAKGVSQKEQAINERIEKLKRFKRWVTHEVLPSIRKTGGYIAGEEDMTEDELVLRAMEVMQNKLKRLEEKTEKLETENKTQFQLIGELKPKADYTDRILKNKGLVTITAIAKDYRMSSQKMNDKLHELGVQYKQSGQWFLYEKYHDNGYTHSETIDLVHKDGTEFVKMNTKWTQKGRLFLYNLLKDNGIVPIIEK